MTSVLIIGVSLLRSLVLSTMVDDDTTGADNGRDTVFVVVKSIYLCGTALNIQKIINLD